MNNKIQYIKNLEESCLKEQYFNCNLYQSVSKELCNYHSGRAALRVAHEIRRIVTAALYKTGQSIASTVHNNIAVVLPEAPATFIYKVEYFLGCISQDSLNETYYLQQIYNECHWYIENQQSDVVKSFADKFVSYVATKKNIDTNPQNIEKPKDYKNKDFAELYGKHTYVVHFSINAELDNPLEIKNVTGVFIDTMSGCLKFIKSDKTEITVNNDWLYYEKK